MSRLRCPFGTLTVITGVSGSGKSSLITDTLAPALANRVNHAHRRTGAYRKITGRRDHRQGDQHRPKPYRSNPAQQPCHLYRPLGRHPRPVRLARRRARRADTAQVASASMSAAAAAKPARATARLKSRCTSFPMCTCPARCARASATIARRCRSPIVGRTSPRCST